MGIQTTSSTQVLFLFVCFVVDLSSGSALLSSWAGVALRLPEAAGPSQQHPSRGLPSVNPPRKECEPLRSLGQRLTASRRLFGSQARRGAKRCGRRSYDHSEATWSTPEPILSPQAERPNLEPRRRQLLRGESSGKEERAPATLRTRRHF